MSTPDRIATGPSARPEEERPAAGRPAAAVLLLLGLGITFVAWWQTASNQQARIDQEFANITQAVRDRLQVRLLEHELMLRGALGMIAAAGRIPNRHEWQLYVDSLNLPRDNTGVLGVGLALRVDSADKAAHVAAFRAQGLPGYRIAPEGERPAYAPVAYLEPMTEEARHTLGRDMFAEAVTRAAMESAVDGGRAAISGRLPNAGNGEERADFMMYVPVFKPGRDLPAVHHRRDALLGFVYSPFLTRDLVAAVLPPSGESPPFRLEIIDESATGDAALLYGAQETRYASPRLLEHRLELPGRTWTLRFSSTPAFEAREHSVMPALVATCGILLSLLVFGLLRTLARQRDWVSARALSMTRELRENRTMLETITESARDAILSADARGRITYLNPAARVMFALGPEEEPGLSLHTLITRWDGSPVLDCRTATASVTECTGRRRDGGAFPIELSVARCATASGSVLNVIVRDISERKFSEQKLELENTIAHVLSGTGSLSVVLSEVIRALAARGGWECGAFWQVADDGTRLLLAASWSSDAPLRDFYGEISEMPVRTHGIGVARRVWSTDAPCWIPDVQSETGMLRAAGFIRADIRSGVAFPINVGKERIGVMELFARQRLPQQQSLLTALASCGVQIAQYCKRKQAEHDLWRTATHDALTGLPNRSMFNESLSQALARAKRHRGRVAVMFLDLDRFKTINDTLGHEAGDAMLTGIAQRLRKVTREVDVVARLGGDEFVVLLEQFSHNDDLALVARRILHELDAPIDCDGHALHATASIGISVSPVDGNNAAALLKCADIAMYRAKQEGRNTFKFYSVSMSANSVERLSLENQLREAIVREEFMLHYQPKAELAGGRIIGVEALIRWNNPSRGMVPPGEFIPLAEESGLILPIGRWALRTACLQGRAWQMEGLPQIRIAVNLSAYQLVPELPAEVEAALDAAGLDAGWLEIEVTESMVMRNPGQAAQILDGLRRLGVHIAMDDFGSGYSSLGALKHLPLDSLKVDRSLVSDLPDDAGDNAICRAIIAMAHALKLKVVAEGVENDAQRDFLRGIGCDEIQGYLLSRPLPAAEASAFIRASSNSRLRLVSSAR